MAAHIFVPYRSILKQGQGITMKSRIAGLLTLMFIVSSAQAANIFETGILRDEIGYQDGNGTTIAYIPPMMGWKNPITGKTNWKWQSFFIDLPMETRNVKKIEAF
jgi:hypothetical protein